MRTNIFGPKGAEEMPDDPGEIVVTVDPVVEIHQVSNSQLRDGRPVLEFLTKLSLNLCEVLVSLVRLVITSHDAEKLFKLRRGGQFRVSS